MLARSRPGLDSSKYLSEDTITALSTAPGGAIGIIRVSGPSTSRVFEKISGSQSWDAFAPQFIKRLTLKSEDGTPLDDVIVLKFANPQSFTGEDLLEIHHHGNPVVSEGILQAIMRLGVRQALPGEFSFRAVRNGKMSLSQAEALSDLLSASNSEAATLALEKLSGSQQSLLLQLAEELRQLAALGEVGIDFSDQDIEELSLERLKKRLQPVIGTLELLERSFQRGRNLQDGIPTVIVGVPNAGKSSFFNSLLGEDRSIVSKVAGTTRDLVRERVVLQSDRRSVTFKIADTAGIRSTSDEVEKLGVERTLKAAKEAELILWVVDLTSVDTVRATIIAKEVSHSVLGVFTKADLVSSDEVAAAQRKLTEVTGVQKWLPTSAVTGQGVAEVADEMVRVAGQWTQRKPGEVLLTRLDHLEGLREALKSLIRAQSTSGLDLFAADIRQALHALSELIGETLPDDVLGRVFSQFCIGK